MSRSERSTVRLWLGPGPDADADAVERAVGPRCGSAGQRDAAGARAPGLRAGPGAPLPGGRIPVGPAPESLPAAVLRGEEAVGPGPARARPRAGVLEVRGGIGGARHSEFLSGVSAWCRRAVCLHPHLIRGGRGCSSMVELQLPKLTARVRFPSPAPRGRPGAARLRAFRWFHHRSRPGGPGMSSSSSSQVSARIPRGRRRVPPPRRSPAPARDQAPNGTPRASTPQNDCPGREARMRIPSMRPHMTEKGARRPTLSMVISNWTTALPVWPK